MLDRPATDYEEACERAKNIRSNPEWRAFIDGIKARCEASAARRAMPARRSDAQFDRDMDAAEGGPDLIKPIYGGV